MTMAFMICAALGSTILVIQFVLAAVGFEGEDVETAEPDHEAGWFFGILSLKSLVAAVAFFGLGGLAAQQAGWGAYFAVINGIGAAIVAMLVVTWLMRMLHSLRSEGNVQVMNTIGAVGSVYLTVPANHEGQGKVTVNVQRRSMEYKAVTEGPELPTGAPIVVLRVVDDETLEVAANN